MSTQVTTLENGLRIATDSMDTIETVSLGMWVDVGTRYESKDCNGISHLLEHMAFKGTKRRSALDIAIEIENVGGQVSAYTSHEHTAYYIKVLREDITLAVDIIADILQYSIFDLTELKREQKVIIQEINQAFDNPDDVIFDHFQEVAYPGQALGQPVLGRVNIVQSIQRDVIVSFMQENYSTKRMVLAAAGRVNHDQLVTLAKKAFIDLPIHGVQPIQEARYVGGDLRKKHALEQVHMVLGFKGLAYKDPDFYTASVLSGLAGGGMSSRLFQEVREKRGLAYSVYTFASSYQDSGLFGVYVGTGENNVEELIPVLCQELVSLATSVNKDEVQRAQAQIRSSFLMASESSTARCEQLARQVLIYGHAVPINEIITQLEAVTEIEVANLARRFLGSPPTFVAIGPLARIEPFDHICNRLLVPG